MRCPFSRNSLSEESVDNSYDVKLARVDIYVNFNEEVNMKKKINHFSFLTFLLIVAVMLTLPSQIWAQSQRTLGLIKRDSKAYEGYTLYKPLGGAEVHLINNAGNPVHKWTIPSELLPPPEGVRPGGEVFLRKNGELVLTADWGIAAIDKDSKIVWKIDSRILGPDRWFGHHEVVELPNGNMLLPGFIVKTRDEAAAAGFDVAAADLCPTPPTPDLVNLRVDNIWELAPADPQVGFKSGWKVVWRWNIWDHFTNDPYDPNKAYIGYIDPAQGICGNYIQGAWTFGRFNALSYNPDRDEIAISESLMNEVWVINHNLTTEQAAGSDGDLIYRWGNPFAYGAGAPFQSTNNRGDQELSFQHRVQWIPKGFPGEGNILIFNNGTDWGDSSVIEIKPPIGTDGNYTRVPGQPYGATVVWQYDEYATPGTFFAALISSAQRLPNGNTLINNGPAGYFFEVTPNGNKVWEYINPNAGAAQGANAPFGVYRSWRYAPNFAGLALFNLSPRDPLEQYPNVYNVDIKPGSCNNPVNRTNRGVLPVAILGSVDVDVTTIDPKSILLEGFSPAKWSIEDVSKLDECSGGDGYPDLVLKWDSELVKVALGNTLPGKGFLMRLTGDSADGWFLGREDVSIVK